MENKCGGGHCGEGHGCHGHMGCGLKMHHLLRYVLMLVLLSIVFCFGFKAGEMKGEIGRYHGFGGDRGEWSQYKGGYGPGMMQKTIDATKQAPVVKTEVKK